MVLVYVLPAVQIKHRRGLDFKSYQGWGVAFLTASSLIKEVSPYHMYYLAGASGEPP